MEDRKGVTPRFSYAVKDLAKYFEIYEQTIPFSSMSNTSSERSFKSIPASKEFNDTSVPKIANSLKTIKESLGKKSISKLKYRHQSSTHQRKLK